MAAGGATEQQADARWATFHAADDDATLLEQDTNKTRSALRFRAISLSYCWSWWS